MNKTFWGTVKGALSSYLKSEVIIAYLKQATVKFALKKMARLAMKSNVYVWIISFVVEELFEEIAEPIIKLGIRKIGYTMDVQDGKKVLKRVEDAQTNNDWRDSIRDS